MFVTNISVFLLFLFQIKGIHLQETKSTCYNTAILPINQYKEAMTRKVTSSANWSHLLDIIYHELQRFEACSDKKLLETMNNSCVNDWNLFNQMTEDLHLVCNYIEGSKCNYKYYHQCVYYPPLVIDNARSIYLEYIENHIGNRAFKLSEQELDRINHRDKVLICCYLENLLKCPLLVQYRCNVDVGDVNKAFMKFYHHLPKAVFQCKEAFIKAHCGADLVRSCVYLLILVTIKVYFL